MRGSVIWIVFAVALAGCSGKPDPAAVKIHGVNFIGASVEDLERSTAFYAGAADLEPLELEQPGGIPVLNELAGEGASLTSERLLRSSNSQLRLMQFGPVSAVETALAPTPVNGPGIAHVCYQVNQETQTYQRLLEAGGQPIGSPEMVRISERKPVDYAYLHDPDGAIVEVEHVDVAALNLETPPANDYRIRHVSLATPDMDAALVFYSRLLGGQKPRRAGRFFKLSGDKLDQISGLPESEIQMAWFQIRNLELEIIQYHSHPAERDAEPRPVNAPGYNMIVFDVGDVGEARQLLLDAGGTLASEAVPMDGGEILFGRDPDGNLLGFQRVEPGALVSSQNFKNNGI